MLDWARQLHAEEGLSDAPAGDPDLADFAWALRGIAQRLGSQLAALEGERRRSAAILDTMESGVIMVNADERVDLINVAAARLLGAGPGPAAGRSLIDITRDHEIVAITRDCLAGRHESRQQLAPNVIELGHPRRHVQVVATPVRGIGTGRAGALVLLEDVTELKQADTIRREFVANVSHELRTPIAGLKALAETLEAGAIEDPPAARMFLARMLIEADRLAQLVEELVELAQLESPSPPLVRNRVDLYQVAARASERLHAKAERAAVSLQVEDPGSELVVPGDPSRLERVFVNLLDNAIKFTPPAGQVSVQFATSDGEVVSSVRDTGQGIAQEDLTRIFERFYKADRARASGGSGLGLAIVKHTVQAHGGRVWATSVEGEGSIFFVALPLLSPLPLGEG